MSCSICYVSSKCVHIEREERPIGEWKSANELEDPREIPPRSYTPEEELEIRHTNDAVHFDRCAAVHRSDVYCSGCAPEGLYMGTQGTPKYVRPDLDAVPRNDGWGHMSRIAPEDEVGSFDIGSPTMDERMDTPEESGGNKLDRGKPNMALLPGHIMADIAAVLTDGAARPEYGPDNWRQGLKIRRLLSAAMRHIMAFNDGQDYDPASPFEPRCHLANAMCMLIFALEMWKTRPDIDDRYWGLDEDMITMAFADDQPVEEVEESCASLVDTEIYDMTRVQLYTLINDLTTRLDILLEVD